MINPNYATDLVLEICRQYSSSWVTKKQITSFLKENGGSFEDVELGISAKKVVYFNNLYTTPDISRMESTIAERLFRLLHSPADIYSEEKIRSYISDFEEEVNNGRKLDEKQKLAVIMCINNKLSILTGGPGTGKTTVLRCIAYVLRHIENGIQIVFTAPTGKAAKQISHATGETAFTTHKYFEINVNNKESDKEFVKDVLFIDESSMLDLSVLNAFIKKVHSGTRVIFVGDVNQLPSVGIGSCLRDMIKSSVIPVTKLTKTFRQAEDSPLFANILKLQNARSDLKNGDDFLYKCIPSNISNEKIISVVVNTYIKACKHYGRNNVMLLLPYKNVGVCVKLFNEKLQTKMNEGKENDKHEYCFKRKDEFIKRVFYSNDPVMQTINRPYASNGDIGFITDMSDKHITVRYEDGDVVYTKSNMDEIELAYAISIHKSQGSEYDCCITLLLEEHMRMLNRNLVFTAVTRSKKSHILFSQTDVLDKAIKIVADEDRHSYMAEKLLDLNQKYKILCA